MADHTTHATACECFSCKLRYWRENGAPGVIYGGGGPIGTRVFHESTLAAEQRKIVSQAANAGIQAVPQGSAG